MYNIFFIAFFVFIESLFSIDIGWKKNVIDNKILTLKKNSSNEERVISARVRGELTIFINGDELSLIINWGEFANTSNANIYYNLDNYGFYESNWPMSKDGKNSYCPNPELLLKEILTEDTLIIGLRPKNNNEIRYIFDISDINEIIYDNIEFFNSISSLLNSPFNFQKFPDKNSLSLFYNDQIKLERDTRMLQDNLKHNDRYFFNPFWFMESLSKNYQLEFSNGILFFFNRWLKKTGTLFTEKDIRVVKFLNRNPLIIPYDTIYDVNLKGNSIIGYRININNKYLTTFTSSNKNQVQNIVLFLKNRIKFNFNS